MAAAGGATGEPGGGLLQFARGQGAGLRRRLPEAAIAWQAGKTVYAEVDLAEDAEAGRYGLHPVLLDAALHALAAVHDTAETRLPFSWEGVRLTPPAPGPCAYA